MGGLTSKYFEEMMHTPPRGTHLLRTDPRSPSDNISRTPISVTDSPEKTGSGVLSTKVLDTDPRSPSAQLPRTPIVVETKEPRRRPFSLKPSRLIDPNTVTDSDDLDPRSPTSRVPRTPLADQTHTFTNLEAGEEVQAMKKEEHMIEETEEKDDQDSSIHSSSSNDENEVPFEAPQEKEYLGLAGGNKRGCNNRGNPRGMLKARQCQAIEAEYSKNQQVIFTQLTDEESKTSVPSNTQFVESI